MSVCLFSPLFCSLHLGGHVVFDYSFFCYFIRTVLFVYFMLATTTRHTVSHEKGTTHCTLLSGGLFSDDFVVTFSLANGTRRFI